MEYQKAILLQLCSPWGRADLAQTSRICARQAERAMEVRADVDRLGVVYVYGDGRRVFIPFPARTTPIGHTIATNGA